MESLVMDKVETEKLSHGMDSLTVEEEVPTSCDVVKQKLVSLLQDWKALFNPSSSGNQFEAKLMSMKHFDARGFLIAAQSQIMVERLEQTGVEDDDEWFDAKSFVYAMMRWIYLGEMDVVTGKWVKELLESTNTAKKVTMLRKQLEDEAISISYGYMYTFNSRKKRKLASTNLRVHIGKKLVMKLINQFITEFTNSLLQETTTNL